MILIFNLHLITFCVPLNSYGYFMLQLHTYYYRLYIKVSNTVSLIESMMVLRPRQGNLRQVFRLFSLTHHHFLYFSTARNEVAIFSAQECKNAKEQLHKMTERK